MAIAKPQAVDFQPDFLALLGRAVSCLCKQPCHEVGLVVAAVGACFGGGVVVAGDKFIGDAVVAADPGGEFHVAVEFFHFAEQFFVADVGADFVFGAVEGPDGDVFEGGGVDERFGAFEAGAGGGRGGGEVVGVDLKKDVGSVSAHGVAEDVDAIHVDGGEVGDDGFDFCEVVAVPEFAGLWSEDVGWKIGAALIFGEQAVPVFELLVVIGAFSATAVKGDDDGIGFGGFEAEGLHQAVGHFRVGLGFGFVEFSPFLGAFEFLVLGVGYGGHGGE